jgi:hypothetical protein
MVFLSNNANAPRIALVDENQRWMVTRFLKDIPTYRGTALATPGETAPLLMRRDGHLTRTP